MDKKDAYKRSEAHGASALPRRFIPAMSFFLTVCVNLGCQKKRETIIDLGEGFEVIQVQDPDPEQDHLLPKQCNPSGKQGKELEECLALNQRYYENFDQEALAREPWYRFATESWLFDQELDPQFVFPVTTLPEAVAKLDKLPVIPLSDEDVFRLTQKKGSFKDRKPFLVRGLAIDPKRGQFNVYQRQKSIFVLHQSIGSAPLQEEHRVPVVLWLTEKPEEIFVDCQFAEQ